MIRLTTMGAVRVHRGETAIADLPAQRLRFALLVYLACDREVSREEVLAMFWPERDTARGKHALRQMLYELRGVLGDDWIELHRDHVVCRAQVDAVEFEEAARDGRVAEALDLYRGPFLAGFVCEQAAFEGWVDRRRAHLARLHRRLQREHIAALIGAGKLDAALTSARRWVELDPLDDEAAHTLIERLFAAGQRTAALQYYESYHKQLAAELQVEPLEATVELVARIRRGEQPADTLVVPAAAPAVPEVVAAPVHAGQPAGATSLPQPPVRRLARLFRQPSARRGAVAAVAVLAILTAAVVDREREARVPAPRTLRVAVLPLDDHTADGSLSSMAAELSDQLTATLGQSRLLEVVSPRSIRLWREEGMTTDSVGRLLGADYLVAGSVRRDRESVSLSLELLDGRDGRLVRNAPVTRPWSESRSLVDDVVSSAVMILREEVGAQLEIRRFRSAASEDAWQQLLEGRDAMNRALTLMRSGEYPASLRQLAAADSLFLRAEHLDRRWSEPLVQRAGVRQRQLYTLEHLVRGTAPTVLDSLRREGLALTTRALKLDSAAVGAYEIRGTLLLERARTSAHPDSAARLRAQAEQALRTATQLDPQRQVAHRHLAQLLFDQGRYGEAHLVARDAHRADPYSEYASGLTYLIFISSFEAGEDAQADSWCMGGRARFSDQGPFMWCLFALHAWGSTAPEPQKLRRELDFAPPVMMRHQPELLPRLEALLAAAFARAGEPDSARAILDRIAALPQSELLWLRAAAHVQLGEHDAALRLLRDYLDRPDAARRVLRQRPFWKLRGNAEFERLTAAD